MSLGQGAPVVLEPPRLLECGRSLTEQDGIAREAKDTICPAVGGDHIHDFRGRTMTSAADQNVGGGPVAPPIRQQPDQDPGMFGPWRAGAGTEGGHDPGLRRPGKNAQRQIAMILIVMMRKRELLLAIRRILGVVQIKDNSGRRCGVAGDEMIHKGLSEPREILTVDVGLQARERRGTGPIVGRVHGRPLYPECEPGVMAEVLGVIGVGIS
jgi:hypothetical protein